MSEVSAVTSSTVSALCARMLVDDGASASGGLMVHVSLETPSLRTGVSGCLPPVLGISVGAIRAPTRHGRGRDRGRVRVLLWHEYFVKLIYIA